MNRRPRLDQVATVLIGGECRNTDVMHDAVRYDENQARATGLGFDRDELNKITYLVVEGLLSNGARVVLGHDWRPGGVMYAVLNAAREYASGDERPTEPLLINVLPWPRKTAMSQEERTRWAGVLEIRESEPPEGHGGATSAPGENAFAKNERALVDLRHQLTHLTQARICIGGKTSGFSGSMPGVMQEAVMALQAGQGVYVTRMLGGASALVLDALERKHWPEIT